MIPECYANEFRQLMRAAWQERWTSSSPGVRIMFSPSNLSRYEYAGPTRAEQEYEQALVLVMCWREAATDEQRKRFSVEWDYLLAVVALGAKEELLNTAKVEERRN